jgi:hypothetical protein
MAPGMIPVAFLCRPCGAPILSRIVFQRLTTPAKKERPYVAPTPEIVTRSSLNRHHLVARVGVPTAECKILGETPPLRRPIPSTVFSDNVARKIQLWRQIE